MALAEWICPACFLEVRALAVEVGHRCPNRKCKWVAFRRVDELEAVMA